MSARFRLLAAALTLTTTLAPLGGPAQHPTGDRAGRVAPEKVLSHMSWLAGSWSGDMWGGRFHAHYSTPEGGMIIGHSKLMKGEKEAFYEFEVFETRELVVWLQPFPGGKKAGGFQLKTHDRDARKAVFENPDKDYPTRIVYERVSDDELLITLTDPHGGSDKVERFELSR